MDFVRKILACQTVEELCVLESLYVLNTLEQSLINERKIEIIMGEQRHELSTELFSTWTPEQVQEFIDEWNDDQPLQQLILDEAPTRQYGRGEKRTIDELDENNNNDNNEDVNDGASTSKQGDDDERYFSVIDKISEVRIKKFKTTALKYVVKLTNTLASVGIPQAYEHVYNMIESLLNTVFSGVAQRDQVRLVLKSPHHKNPSLFLSWSVLV